MSDFQDRFYAAVTEWMQAEFPEKNVVAVTDIDQTTYRNGFCETCEWDETVLEISYTDASGNYKLYTWSGDMGELMRNLP